MTDEHSSPSALILYQTEDGRTRIECRFEDETVWLTQKLMAELFQIGVGTVNHHLKAIYAERELSPESTVRRHRIVRTEGRREVEREIEHYSLEAILAVGYRVRSHMHWATHGHTAAEIVHERADARKPFMGMQTIRPGGIIRKTDAAVAKNYLTEPELQVLHRIVNLYIEYAELQALERRQMKMSDWIAKLDDFLRASGRELLDHAGRISAEAAQAKAESEYAQYHALQDAQPRAVDAEFERAAKQLQRATPKMGPKQQEKRGKK